MSAPDDSVPADCSSIICPEDQNDTYHPHPTDPGKFCQCSNGVPYEMPCPEGMHFNPESNVCDWPQNAAAARARMGLADLTT